MNAIGYSIFGYGKQHDNCFSFQSYLRGLSLNLRMASIIYPSWHINIAVDESTYNSPYKQFFDYHDINPQVHIDVVPDAPLCVMMLHRLNPIFNGYDRVICRDIDSLVTYRERQAVDFWIKTGRVAHGIGDSVSHTLVFLGGMCGFISDGFKTLVGVNSLQKLMALDATVDYNQKGSDQHTLNKIVLPKVASSIVEHFPLGMPNSFREHFYNHIQDEPIEDIAPILKESNLLTSHIGASGFYEAATLKFFDKFLTGTQKDWSNRGDEIFPEIFYWVNEK